MRLLIDPTTRQRPVLALAACALLACLDAAEPPLPTGRRLRDIEAAKFPDGSVLIGGTTNWEKLARGSGEVLAREFRYTTPENDFKHSRIHPRPGEWRWEKADKWLGFARENHQLIRIHGPIGPQTSPWSRADGRTPAELERSMTEFLTKLCQRYNGAPQVRWMDVVNETVQIDGSWFGDEPGIQHWENPWPQMGIDPESEIGTPIYIRKAFEIANRHAPDLELVFNQHGSMEKPMWDRVKAVVDELRGRGLRVDGLGWQAHVDVGWEKDPANVEALRELIDWTHARGMTFHVTEANVWLRESPKDYDAQAETFAAVLRVLLEKRGQGKVTWSTWNLSDGDAYELMKEFDGSIFFPDFTPKPAYYALQAVLESPPPVEASSGGFRSHETEAGKNERMAWWRDAKFGMFVHWGLYAAAEGRWKGTSYPKMRPGIEWLMCKGGHGPGGGGIPVDDYVDTLAPKMTLDRFDPDAWAGLAREAGMRYFVITAKHHDGFGMVDFPGTDYDIAGHTPYGKDPMIRLSQAIRDKGLHFGFYFSQSQDWSKPGGRPKWFTGLEGDWTDYARQHAVPQLRHLLGGTYGPVDLLWFDSGSMTLSHEGAEAIWNELAAAPRIIVNNRLKQGFDGDFATPEQWIPPSIETDHPWETCMTLNGSWGYNPTDAEWKSEAGLIRTLCEVVGRGGNLLLNVGPRPDGTWEPEAAPRLRAIGRWLETNGEAIYGTRGNPLGLQRWGELTMRSDADGTTLYGLVTRWPETGSLPLNLAQDPSSIEWLGASDSQPTWERTEDGLLVHLNRTTSIDPEVSVFRINLNSSPTPSPMVVHPNADGALTFTTSEAERRGGVRFHAKRPQLTGWNRPQAEAVWQFRVPEPGRYRLRLRYGCRYPAGIDTGRTAFVATLGRSAIRVPVGNTGHVRHPHNPELETVELRDIAADGLLDLPDGLQKLRVTFEGGPDQKVRLTREQQRNGYGDSPELDRIVLEKVAP